MPRRGDGISSNSWVYIVPYSNESLKHSARQKQRFYLKNALQLEQTLKCEDTCSEIAPHQILARESSKKVLKSVTKYLYNVKRTRSNPD
jgi:hypothetical protein